MGNTHPLESLAAFAISFVAGVLSTLALSWRLRQLKPTSVSVP